jgi:hypothetical protein
MASINAVASTLLLMGRASRRPADLEAAEKNHTSIMNLENPVDNMDAMAEHESWCDTQDLI